MDEHGCPPGAGLSSGGLLPRRGMRTSDRIRRTIRRILAPHPADLALRARRPRAAVNAVAGVDDRRVEIAIRAPSIEDHPSLRLSILLPSVPTPGRHVQYTSGHRHSRRGRRRVARRTAERSDASSPRRSPRAAPSASPAPPPHRRAQRGQRPAPRALRPAPPPCAARRAARGA